MKRTLLAVLFAFALNMVSAEELREKTRSHSCQFEPENEPSPFVTKATEMVFKIKPTNLIVLDLGVGTGRNIKNLLEKGATVYAYDADPASIKLIRREFSSFLNSKKLYVLQESFEEISSLPAAEMIIAWRSLSFMEEEKFPAFWKKIEEALAPGGIFTGTFFGKQHKTKRPLNRPKLFRLTREEVFNLFKDFLIVDFQESMEYDEEVSEEWGGDQFEHIYKVIAKKRGA
jgi:SAM-dependent methyltransferase